jgi:hypothetical protein
MAQVISRRPLTAEAPVRSQATLCGIYCGRRGGGTGPSPSTSVFPFHYQYQSTSAPFSHFIHLSLMLYKVIPLHAVKEYGRVEV